MTAVAAAAPVLVDGWGLAAAVLLVAVAVAVSARFGLGLGATMGWASLRATVQLLVVGFGLLAVIGDDRPLVWSYVWVAAMVVVAADVVRRRVDEVAGLFRVAVAAIATAVAVGLGVLFGASVFPLEGRTMVPLAGIMIGNSLGACVLSARRVSDELSVRRREIEVRLALGYDRDESVAPHLRTAVRAALIPQIESTRTVGLIALPGTMTGLILAGVEPVDAVLAQIVVMFLVLAAAATTATIVGVGVVRLSFTPDLRLIRRPSTA